MPSVESNPRPSPADDGNAPAPQGSDCAAIVPYQDNQLGKRNRNRSVISDSEDSDGKEPAGHDWKRRIKTGDRAKTLFVTWSNTEKPGLLRPSAVSRKVNPKP